MIKWAIGIPLESIVIVEGVIQKPIEDIKTCSVSKLEIKLDKIFLLAQAPAKLPFLLEDASRPVDVLPKVLNLLTPSICRKRYTFFM
jgi:aspartyl-tRNA synthetase